MNLSLHKSGMHLTKILLATALLLVSGSLALYSPFKAVSATNAGTYGTGPVTDISGALSIAQPPIITNVGDNVYVSYPQATPKEGVQMYFQEVTDNGTTVVPKVLISSGLDNNSNVFQRIAAVGSYVYITWQYDTTFGESI